MKRICLVIVLLVSMVSLVGCAQRVTDFTVISTKNVDLSRGAEFTRGAQRVEGNDTSYSILLFSMGIPDTKEAIDRAIEGTAGAVALVDGVVEREAANFLLFGYTTIRIKGTPLLDPKLLKR